MNALLDPEKISTHKFPPFNRNRIVHLTTVHPRRAVRILPKECKALVESGYEVHFVIGDGLGNDIINGIQVHDIGEKPESRIRRFWVQSRKAARKIHELQPAIVHFHDPELLPLGMRLVKKGIHVIYDVHEDVPRQIITKQYIPRPFRPIIARTFEYFENYASQKLYGLIAATPHIAERFSKQGLNIININNYPLLEELNLSADDQSGRRNQICYIGCISKIRGLLQVVRALPLLPNIRLKLCGLIDEPGFHHELQSDPGWSQVDYLGMVDRATAHQIMNESIAGLVTFLPEPNHVSAQPNKLFEYMAAKLPAIASNFPLWQQIINNVGCGICIDPKSPEQIAAAIRSLQDEPNRVEKMGGAGQQAILNEYNWSLEAKKLVHFYKKIPSYSDE